VLVLSLLMARRKKGTGVNNYLLLGTCFLLGVFLNQTKQLPDNAAAALSGFVVNISLPALTLIYLHGLKVDSALIMPALMAWLVFGIACAFFWIVGRTIGLSRPATGGLMLTGGLANTSFIGLPMIETFYGPENLGLGILIDQLGSYFVLSTFGILIASIYSSGRTVSAKAIAIKIVNFRPFQAFVLAFMLMPLDYPSWTVDLLKHLGATLVPLALVSVGYQLRLSQFKGRTLALAIGLGFKLLIAPAIILALYSIVFGEVGSNLQITVFESAMAPMIGASMVAIDHELDPPLLTLMVGVGIPLSFLTLPAWWYVLQRFA
jgi:malate permease and related proteins